MIQAQSWKHSASLLILDEVHKMRHWKPWLKGVVDGRPPGQQLLVTGSARMDTFRESGESLAGRYFRFRLHPLSVREWSEQTQVTPHAALSLLLERGGCPEPALAASDIDAQRWRVNYFAGPSVFREPLLLTAALGVGLFVLAQARAASPLIRLATLRDVGLRAGLATSVLVASVMMGTLVVGPFYLSQGLGLDTAMVGLAIALRSGFARGPTLRPAP